MSEKMNILFNKDENTEFNADTITSSAFFNKVDVAPDRHKALKLIFANNYDIIINDISTNAIDGISFMLQIKDFKPKQNIVALVALEDEDKIGGLIETGIHIFVLTPADLEQALEAISRMTA